MLTQVNVWLDVVFTALYVVVVVGLSGHFLGNLLTKRAYRRFVKKEWPHHEGPPVPFLPKFLHFQHVAMMFLLGFSGMYIRFPFFDGGRTAMRYLHYFAMIVVTVNIVWRLWYAFLSKQRDYREFAITKQDIVTAPKVVLYYIFVKPSKPHLAKYNVMQKGTYTLFVPLMLIQAFTGFSLVTATFIFGLSPRDIFVGWWLGPIVGGTALAGAWARVAHYVVNWLFIILTTVHAYLSITEDMPAFLNFFGLRSEEHEHGESPDHAGDHGHTLPHEPATPAVAEPATGHGSTAAPFLSEAE
jgi:Ni,Fe-hydrogenase I cytochrome b subunit